MNKTLLNVLTFTAGAVVGSAVTWVVIKSRYKQIADEEIASVKEEYVNIMTTMKNKLKKDAVCDESKATVEIHECLDDDDNADEDNNGIEIVEYNRISSGYRSEENKNKNKNKNEKEGTKWDQDEDDVPYINGPYVISPEDFSSSPPGYNAEALVYFADGVLADDWGVILDLDETIGEDAVNHFGEYAEDIVYIRNEMTEIDYEVTRDPRTYVDMLRTNPNPNYGNYEN